MKKPTTLPTVQPEASYAIRLLVAGICIGLLLAIFAGDIARWLVSQDDSEMRVAQELEHVIREEQAKARREAAAPEMCRDIQKSEVAVSELEDGTFFCATKRGMNVTRISI
jgi:hypothetical protein